MEANLNNIKKNASITRAFFLTPIHKQIYLSFFLAVFLQMIYNVLHLSNKK
jgi:hypothetical protein